MFTEKIQKLANEKNVTINKVAKDLGMSTGTFSTWKKRGTIPNAEIVSKIADYFNVTVDYLLGKPEQKEKSIVVDDGLSEKDKLIIELACDLPDDKFQQAVDYLKYLSTLK